MNHAMIAAQALRFRYRSIHGGSADCSGLDLESWANRAVACADPEIDSAIRQLVSTLVVAGVDADRLVDSWDCPEVAPHFRTRPELLDLVDTIARQLTLQPTV